MPLTQTWPIRFIKPGDTLPALTAACEAAHQDRQFSLQIDLTGGHIANHVQLPVPAWNELHISRLREVSRAELPTSGHLISHNPAEIRQALNGADLSNVLLLDDTSFSGNTSIIAEDLLRSAFPELAETINFIHGFLILNTGRLGGSPGAKERLESQGTQTLAGMTMQTPLDDGWHLFDLVKHRNLLAHLDTLQKLLEGKAVLSDESTRRLLFPELLTSGELERRRQVGRFVGRSILQDGMHTRNPQLLPGIIAQGHLLPPNQWRHSPEATFKHLARLGEIITLGEQS